MKKSFFITTLLPVLVWSMVVVDDSDLPPIKKEASAIISERPSPKVGLNKNMIVDQAKWDSIEICFTQKMTQREKEKYYQLKEQFILYRAKIQTKKDSIRTLGPALREAAIKTMWAQTQEYINDVNISMESRFSEQELQAWRQYRKELQNRQAELNQQLLRFKEKMDLIKPNP